MYRIVITRLVQNPDYDADEARRYHQSQAMDAYNRYDPSKITATFEDKALTVDLTDEEFKAVKKAVLDCM